MSASAFDLTDEDRENWRRFIFQNGEHHPIAAALQKTLARALKAEELNRAFLTGELPRVHDNTGWLSEAERMLKGE